MGLGKRKFLIPEKELSNIAFFVLLSFTAKESKKNTLISNMKFNVLKIVIAKTAERFRVPRCESRQELSHTILRECPAESKYKDTMILQVHISSMCGTNKFFKLGGFATCLLKIYTVFK